VFELFFAGRLAGVGKGIAVAGTEQQNVDVASFHAGKTGFTRRSSLGGEILEAKWLVRRNDLNCAARASRSALSAYVTDEMKTFMRATLAARADTSAPSPVGMSHVAATLDAWTSL
jgi:hypothetical protein